MAGNAAPDKTTQLLERGEFHFIRCFLWWVLGSLLALVTGVLAASWYLAMDVAVEGQGAIRPRTRCLVKPRVEGVVQAVLVTEGESVTQGQALIQLDDSEWRHELAKLELELRARDSQQAALEHQIAGERRVRQADIVRTRYELGQAQVALDRVLTENRLAGRLRDLLPDWSRRPLEELVPVQQATAEARTVGARLALAESALAALEGRDREVTTLRERRAQLEKERQRLDVLLERAVICAPVAGVVLTGELHRLEGDRVVPGQPVLQLAGEDGWMARIEVDERDRPQIQVGQQARVYARAFPHMEYRLFQGTVVQVALQTTRDERSYTTDIAIEDPVVSQAGRDYSVRDGMSVTARIVVDSGRISGLARKRLLRHLGRRPLPEVYPAGHRGAG